MTTPTTVSTILRGFDRAVWMRAKDRAWHARMPMCRVIERLVTLYADGALDALLEASEAVPEATPNVGHADTEPHNM